MMVNSMKRSSKTSDTHVKTSIWFGIWLGIASTGPTLFLALCLYVHFIFFWLGSLFMLIPATAGWHILRTSEAVGNRQLAKRAIVGSVLALGFFCFVEKYLLPGLVRP